MDMAVDHPEPFPYRKLNQHSSNIIRSDSIPIKYFTHSNCDIEYTEFLGSTADSVGPHFRWLQILLDCVQSSFTNTT